MKIPRCPYCDRNSELVLGKIVYPKIPELHAKWFYRCDPCDAHVGVHPGTLKPLGTLAKPALRRKRSDVHKIIDGYWKSGRMTRDAVYRWLGQALQLSAANCHVGMFTLEQCYAVIELYEKGELFK